MLPRSIETTCTLLRLLSMFHFHYRSIATAVLILQLIDSLMYCYSLIVNTLGSYLRKLKSAWQMFCCVVFKHHWISCFLSQKARGTHQFSEVKNVNGRNLNSVFWPSRQFCKQNDNFDSKEHLPQNNNYNETTNLFFPWATAIVILQKNKAGIYISPLIELDCRYKTVQVDILLSTLKIRF